MQLVRVWKHEAMDTGDSGHQDNHMTMCLMDTDATKNRGILETEADCITTEIYIKGFLCQLQNILMGTPGI